MSALLTPPITPFEATFLDVVNDIAEAHHPSPAIPAIPAIPHNFSLTPLQLLPKRLNYRRHQARQNPQAQVVMVTEAEITIAGPQMQNAMWGIDRVSESERAEAAAILEATVDRWFVSQNGGMLPRWVCDDEVCMPLLLLSGIDADKRFRRTAAVFTTVSGESKLLD